MLLVQNFTIRDSYRMNEFLAFKGDSLTETNFRIQPVLSPRDGSYKISISSNVEDVISLESLFDKWQKEDTQAETTENDLGFLDKLLVNLRA